MTNTELPSKKPHPKDKLKRILLFLLKMLIGTPVLFVSVLSLIALFGSESRTLELLTHFKLHYLLALAASVPFLILGRMPWLLVPVGICMALNLTDIAPLYFKGESASSNTVLKVMSLNINKFNLDPKPSLAAIRAKNPDLICLQELTPTMSSEFQRALPEYRYHFLNPEEGFFGLGIYSKLPLENTSTRKLSDDYMLTQFCTVVFDQRKITLVNTHPIAPLDDYCYKVRNQQLINLGKFCLEAKEPLIVAGDLNSTSYSPYFKNLLKEGNLKDSQIGFGVQATWLTQTRLANIPLSNLLLGLPLDHILYKGNISVTERQALAAVGSDHIPLFTELSFN